MTSNLHRVTLVSGLSLFICVSFALWLFAADVASSHLSQVTLEESRAKEGGADEGGGSELILFDFTRLNSVSDWEEQSDTKRQVGMSKATLVLQVTQIFQRAIFFTMLNPQPNGAGFAGMRIPVELDLSSFTNISMHLRGQGSNSGYKINLRHRGENNEPFPSYEQYFTAPMGEFREVFLSLDEFEPYYRGRKVPGAPALDKSRITNFEIQVYGGVYLPIKQKGVSTLEIDYIKAVR